jgi:8-oxo-dGTP diphosphatase
MITNYVVGFAFNTQRDTVLLIHKQRPEWQKGLLNGIGGHVEKHDQSYHNAQAREFLEETGVWVSPDRWRHFAKIEHGDSRCYCFTTVTDNIYAANSRTDEQIVLAKLAATCLPLKSNIFPYEPVRNLRYLVSLAADEEQKNIPVFVYR